MSKLVSELYTNYVYWFDRARTITDGLERTRAYAKASAAYLEYCNAKEAERC